ncbi:hypothetical protein ALC57_06376 [Trachymyrmex cornetzi]|uniref:Uncharacterized protein n=1 Tax=Trachymyrmex cornetzi TaxID=471704 RepID=A0A151J8U5_9HYME|nr:hypothetical protein ALC57_06376 [Trachymyrmex cornetzi]
MVWYLSSEAYKRREDWEYPETSDHQSDNEFGLLWLTLLSSLTHSTKSPCIEVLSRTKNTPPSFSPINKSDASCRDIAPKYQLKRINYN